MKINRQKTLSDNIKSHKKQSYILYIWLSLQCETEKIISYGKRNIYMVSLRNK